MRVISSDDINKTDEAVHATHKLSAVRALLGAITNNIRAVLIGWDEEKVYLKFVTIDAPTEEEYESLPIAATEISADFPDKDVIEEIASSDCIPSALVDDNHPYFIFLRHE